MSTPLPAVMLWATQIRHAARQHALPPGLVASIVEQESRGDATAWNPEPRYPYLWDVAAKAPRLLRQRPTVA